MKIGIICLVLTAVFGLGPADARTSDSDRTAPELPAVSVPTVSAGAAAAGGTIIPRGPAPTRTEGSEVNALTSRPQRGFQLAQSTQTQPADASTWEDLERIKKELETEYQYLVEEASRLKEVKEKLKSNQERRLYNDWIEALNQRVAAYEKNRKDFEKKVAAFQATVRKTPVSAQPDGAAVEQQEPPEPAETPEDQAIIQERERIHEREQQLNAEYESLMREKTAIEAAIEAAKSGDGPPVEETTVNDLNQKIQTYEKRRQALNAAIEAYNQKAASPAGGTKPAAE